MSGNEDISFILDPDTARNNNTHAPTALSPGKTPIVPSESEAGWYKKQAWMFLGKKEKLLPLPEIEP
jgi:hypothetical protein